MSRTSPGGGIIGTFGGSGQYVKWPKLSGLTNKRIPYPITTALAAFLNTGPNEWQWEQQR